MLIVNTAKKTEDPAAADKIKNIVDVMVEKSKGDAEDENINR